MFNDRVGQPGCGQKQIWLEGMWPSHPFPQGSSFVSVWPQRCSSCGTFPVSFTHLTLEPHSSNDGLFPISLREMVRWTSAHLAISKLPLLQNADWYPRGWELKSPFHPFITTQNSIFRLLMAPLRRLMGCGILFYFHYKRSLCFLKEESNKIEMCKVKLENGLTSTSVHIG